MTAGRALLCTLLSGVCLPAYAQTSPPAQTGVPAQPASPVAFSPAAPTAADPGGSSAVTTLIRQAERWLAQGRPDLASLSITRALAAEPQNPEALLVASRIETARNNRDAAVGYLRRAQNASTTPEQRDAASAALRTTTLDQVALEQARRLAREGRADEAASRYRALFGPPGPTPDYAREYYQVLASSAVTRAEGLAGLSRLAGAPNADPDTQLASAEALTYQEQTRAEGIDKLAALAARPETAAAAQRAWRQALGFLGTDPAAAPLIEAYLKRFGADPELTQRLTALRQAPVAAPSPGDALRREGFAQLDAGALRSSAERFQAALAANPNDADALGGLGLVRLRDNRPDEARPLLERAVAADPARAAQWQKALDGAVYGVALTDARTLLRRGDVAGADALLRDAVRRDVPDRTDAESMLGEVALRQNDAAGAEQHFRTALSRRPGFPPAVTGLNQSLRAQGKLVEAPVRAATSDTAAASTALASSGRVSELRAEAATATDPSVAVILLRSALELAPLDPWVRLDLARALKRQGRGAEGRALVEELAAQVGTADTHFAAALLAQEDGRLDDADAQLTLIPIGRRTPDMARLQARVRTDRDVARARASMLADAAVGRPQLMLIAARPDPSGATAAAVIRAFAEASDRAGAVEAARVALAANPTAGPTARLTIAGALLSAGADTDAAALADLIPPATLSGDQQRDLASLRTGIAIRASDRLNEGGAQAQAFDRLRPVLAQDPDSVEGQLALARLYQGARQPAQALRVAQSVLARDPHNFAARQGAVDAAIALGDRRTALILVTDAPAYGPTDSRLLFLQARVASSFGDTTRAQMLLKQALELRQAELGTVSAGTDSVAALPNPFPRQVGAAIDPASLPADPLSRQIVQLLATTQAANAPSIAFAPTVQQRSGSPGLDQMTAVVGTIEGSIPTPGIGGEITGQIQPSYADSGQLGSSLQTAYRFGTNPLLGSKPIIPKNAVATGVGLNVSYKLDDLFKLNIGTTPLGFRNSTIVGGVEFAPRLGEQVRMRLTGYSRAVTDSVLSWAGLNDPASHTTWGSVVISGGKAQLEGPLGQGSWYAGGGYGVLTGVNVAPNSRSEAGAGFVYPVLKTPESELTAGMNLIYFGYANNQRAFTVGNGGYFSPQSYGAINVPIDYRAKIGNFSYHVGATVGFASFSEKASPVFPDNASLQSQLVTAAASNPLLSTTNPSQTRNGFVGGIRVELAYQLTPGINMSAGASFDQAPQYNETNVMVRLAAKF